MKTEKPRKIFKTRAQLRAAKIRPVKAGIRIRAGLRAGYLMGFTDMY